MFIETLEGQIINLAHVVAIRRYPAKAGDSNVECFCEFDTTAGERLTGHIRRREAESGHLNDLNAREIPAAAGFFLLQYDVLPDVGEYISREPIIGWRFTPGWECPSPLTVVGHTHGAQAYVLHPDGSVSDPDMARWDNYQMWLANMQKEHLKPTPWQLVYPGEAEI